MNKRCQQWGVFKDERLPFMTIAKINNITLSCLYSRWKRDNCPDIPFADLIHLSSTKNTGAGRGEFDNISYSGMKAIQAVRFLGIER